MSTMAYAAMTTRRTQATSESAAGVRGYVDAAAALVPAEVLTLHALILSVTTQTGADAAGDSVTTITQPATLRLAFWGLVVLSVFLYAVPRVLRKSWDRLDFLRASIAPLAFVAWTMLQRATAFDAVWPGLEDAPRTVVALFVAAVLGTVAVFLAERTAARGSSQAKVAV